MINVSTPTIPTTLKLVASLFILYGLWALFDIATGLAAGQLRPNFGVLCLLIGPGLLARNEIARVCALAVTVVFMTYTVGAVVSYVIHRPEWVSVPLVSRLVGQLHGPERTWYVVIASAAFLALNVWQVWVLGGAQARRLFGGHGVNFR